MGGISLKYKFILLSNHKCGSTTLLNILTPYLDIKTEGKLTSWNETNDLSRLPWKHSTLDEWKTYCKLKRINIYKFKTITTTRNPWKRMMSLYNYGSEITKKYPVEFNKCIQCVLINNNYKRFIDFTKNIDYVIKLEDLHEVLPIIMASFGIVLNRDIKNTILNKSSNKGVVYNKNTIEMIGSYFKREIEMLDYKICL